MEIMFEGTSSFCGDLSKWDTSKVWKNMGLCTRTYAPIHSIVIQVDGIQQGLQQWSGCLLVPNCSTAISATGTHQMLKLWISSCSGTFFPQHQFKQVEHIKSWSNGGDVCTN